MSHSQAIIIISATDADTPPGPDSTVRYGLDCDYPGEISFRFEIDSRTGVLTVNERMGEVESELQCRLTVGLRLCLEHAYFLGGNRDNY